MPIAGTACFCDPPLVLGNPPHSLLKKKNVRDPRSSFNFFGGPDARSKTCQPRNEFITAKIDAPTTSIIEAEPPQADTLVFAKFQDVLAAAVNLLGCTMPFETVLKEQVSLFSADVCAPKRALVVQESLTLANQFRLDC